MAWHREVRYLWAKRIPDAGPVDMHDRHIAFTAIESDVLCQELNIHWVKDVTHMWCHAACCTIYPVLAGQLRHVGEMVFYVGIRLQGPVSFLRSIKILKSWISKGLNYWSLLQQLGWRVYITVTLNGCIGVNSESFSMPWCHHNMGHHQVYHTRDRMTYYTNFRTLHVYLPFHNSLGNSSCWTPTKYV